MAFTEKKKGKKGEALRGSSGGEPVWCGPSGGKDRTTRTK